ncbi:restriction endonuclease subunit S [Parafilimonas terrae]|uniref:Type I restriction enzyme, S subunit n=1 Tax=Parafilimonas terrae TaxID=1465490 RepID=A0A1I5WE97_9BACT|nr:restriction endonuclease subunit S [Parafilimonas terrae]SFQ18062.1 type I restriction enzyme, S subunit [Parafilimonas terrae]
MELVETKYKETEVGLIPEDWEVKELGEIGAFSKGKGINKSDSNSGNIPAIRYGELYTHHNYIIKSFHSFISKNVSKQSKLLKKGDLLFAGSGETKEEIGKCAAFIFNDEVYAGGDVIILSPQKDSSIFLGYALNSKIVNFQKASKGQGDAVVHIYPKTLSEIKLPLPPLPEQKAIAEALSDTDAWIESLEKLIAKKRLIKQGAMQQLLTPKEGWEVKKLGAVATVIGGGTPSTSISEYWNGSIEWFTPTEIGYSKYLFSSKRKISISGLNNSSAIILPIGAILMTSRAVIGDLGILKIKACTNQGFQSLLVSPENDNEFIYYLMSTKKSTLLQNASGSTFLEISPTKVKSIEVVIPNKKEQTRIASILSNMDSEIEVLEKKLVKAQQIKRGMMQALLTGKVRLV